MDRPNAAGDGKPWPADERREFFRVEYRNAVKFRQLQDPQNDLKLGTTENISQSGLLFKSRVLPPLSSILWMDLDLRTLKICQEIESRALVYDKGLLGRVVRVEEDPEETKVYNVGVCFIRKDESGIARNLDQIVF